VHSGLYQWPEEGDGLSVFYGLFVALLVVFFRIAIFIL
jgi:hypothetical protein